MSKKMKKLIASALIAGSIIGTGVVAYAYPICDCGGQVSTHRTCCDWHCQNCGCLGDPR